MFNFSQFLYYLEKMVSLIFIVIVYIFNILELLYCLKNSTISWQSWKIPNYSLKDNLFTLGKS